MDNTGNGQNQLGATQPGQPQAAPTPSFPQAQPPQPIQQVPVTPQPQQVSQSVPNPVSPTTTAPTKITLDDLYGPSGFADKTSHVAQPAQQAEQSIEAPPVAPVQSTNIQPQEPVAQQVPNLPTVSPSQTMQQTPTEVASQELPLRPQRSEIPSTSIPEVSQAEVIPPIPPTNQNPTEPKPKKGMNKLLIFRILFGGIAAIVALVVILFVVTWLSSLFHSSSSNKVTITYWGLWEDSNTMQVAISDFEKQNPNISINYEKEDPKDYSQRLLTRIQQGNGPDIFTYHSSWLPMVQSVLVPLPTNVISKDDLQNNFYPVVRTDLVKNGALYGIPLEVDTLSLFVNNALFKTAKAQVPDSWDNFTATARALTQKDENGKIKIAGAALGTFDNITHAPDIISMLFAQNGVAIATLSPKSNVSDALSFYTSFATGDSNVWDNTLDPSQLAFIKGNLAMYFGYSWDVFTIKAANANLDFSIYPVPHLPGRNTTAASYWVEGVSVKSAHQKEALLFMHYLQQKNTESLLYAEEAKTRLFGEPYARSDLGVTLKSNPLVYPFLSQATDATSSFFAGETQDSGINGQMNGYLGNAVRSILNSTSPDTAVDTLFQGVQQVENQYGSQ